MLIQTILFGVVNNDDDWPSTVTILLSMCRVAMTIGGKLLVMRPAD